MLVAVHFALAGLLALLVVALISIRHGDGAIRAKVGLSALAVLSFSIALGAVLLQDRDKVSAEAQTREIRKHYEHTNEELGRSVRLQLEELMPLDRFGEGRYFVNLQWNSDLRELQKRRQEICRKLGLADDNPNVLIIDQHKLASSEDSKPSHGGSKPSHGGSKHSGRMYGLLFGINQTLTAAEALRRFAEAQHFASEPAFTSKKRILWTGFSNRRSGAPPRAQSSVYNPGCSSLSSSQRERLRSEQESRHQKHH